MATLAVNGLVREMIASHWNSVTGKKWQFVDETATHMRFLHPTKGYRSVHKRRLRLPF